MTEILELTVDKFTFRFPTDRYYHPDGVWALPEGDGRVRIGLSDFAQQSGGDVAFAEVKPEGTTVVFGEEVASVETMKTDIIVPAPASGTVVEVNPALEMTPEVINEDPYGEGWLAVIEATDWEADRARLEDAPAYLERVREIAEEEMRKR
ncbi:MAG: glycine cleavage system protein H, partial [Anaerolineae bacterium]